MTQLETFLREHEACAEGARHALRAGWTTTAHAWKGSPRGDWQIWMLRKAGKLDRRGWVGLATRLAAKRLPVYLKGNSRSAPRRALEAAARWVQSPTEANRRAAAAAGAAAAEEAEAASERSSAPFPDAADAARAAACAALAASAPDDAAAEGFAEKALKFAAPTPETSRAQAEDIRRMFASNPFEDEPAPSESIQPAPVRADLPAPVQTISQNPFAESDTPPAPPPARPAATVKRPEPERPRPEPESLADLFPGERAPGAPDYVKPKATIDESRKGFAALVDFLDLPLHQKPDGRWSLRDQSGRIF